MLLRNIAVLLMFNLLITDASRAAQNEQVETLNLTGLKVRIETNLLKESIEFYSEYLGLTILDQWDEQGDSGVILGLDSKLNSKAFLEFGYKNIPNNYLGVSIQIRVNSLVDAMRKLQGKVKFSEPEERPWGSRYLYLIDPNGITVILYQGKL